MSGYCLGGFLGCFGQHNRSNTSEGSQQQLGDRQVMAVTAVGRKDSRFLTPRQTYSVAKPTESAEILFIIIIITEYS